MTPIAISGEEQVAQLLGAENRLWSTGKDNGRRGGWIDPDKQQMEAFTQESDKRLEGHVQDIRRGQVEDHSVGAKARKLVRAVDEGRIDALHVECWLPSEARLQANHEQGVPV